MSMNFDYTLEPGKELKRLEFKDSKVTISVVVPYYNAAEFIDQTVISVLNQTYPYFEILVVNDGSTEEASIKKLKEVEKMDKRIKVLNKENGGVAATRDYGAEHSSKDSEYLFFLDADDVIEPTYLECAYWTLQTHPDAAWAYADSVGFGTYTYTWEKWFDSKRMKKENTLVDTALIRKSVFNEVNGYELRVKSVNEDWNFWLKLLAKGYYPIHMNFFAFWYRRKETGSELQRVKNNQKVNSQIIKDSASKVDKDVIAIQYPTNSYNYEDLIEVNPDIAVPVLKDDKKINILMIIPWMIMGGADIFNMEFLKRIDKDKFNITIINTLPNYNIYRQSFEQYATIYDLTTFLDHKDWLSFVNYIIEKNNINFIFNTNSECGYAMLPYLKAKYPNIPIIDYIHMEEWYFKNGGFARMSSAVEAVIDKTLVCNNGTERVLTDYFGRKPEEVKTVYIGVDSNKFDPDKFDKEELLKKYELEDNDKYVISYICRIANQKRPYLLAEIMKKAIARRKDILFLIVGNGEMLTGLKAKVSSYGIGENVRFLGPVSNTGEIYKISDMTINCSIKEGLALTAYESLSMGVPVISADVGGQKELINDKTGVIVPCLQKEYEIANYDYSDEEVGNYVEAIDKVIANLDDYKKRCRKRILNEFTLEKMGINMTKEIEEVFKHPSKEKIENGKNLAPSKAYLLNNLMNFYVYSCADYEYCIRLYHKGAFKIPDNPGDRRLLKHEAFRDTMWRNPIWRGFVKSPIWKAGKRIVRRNKGE